MYKEKRKATTTSYQYFTARLATIMKSIFYVLPSIWMSLNDMLANDDTMLQSCNKRNLATWVRSIIDEVIL